MIGFRVGAYSFAMALLIETGHKRRRPYTDPGKDACFSTLTYRKSNLQKNLFKSYIKYH